MKSYALITGASGGIGREFVYEYARHHFNLVLVARNEEKLNALKLELEKTWHIRVLVIAEDLSDEDAALRIYDRVRAEGIHVDSDAGWLSFLYSSEVHQTVFLEFSSITMNLSLGERPV